MFHRSLCLVQGRKLWLFLSVLMFVVILSFFQYNYLKLKEDRDKLEATVSKLQTYYNLKENAKLQKQRRDYDEGQLIIYNRVPKTASTSFVNVAYDLCKKNGFNVLHLNVTGNLHFMSIADQARFIRNITKWTEKKPAIYHGHVAFIDFLKFGAREKPIYLNLLRRPLDRLVSYYYFLRYGDNFRPHLIRRKHGDKMTFDECVQQKQPDCNPENMWLQIPFLCGHSSECWEPGNEWALEEAKRNLLSHYLVVGVTEQLTDFIAVLEATLPSFFSGAIEHFKSSKKGHLRKTNQKIEPNEETIRQIKSTVIWKMENELYEFALQQFQFLKKRMERNKDGDLVDKGQQFMYEKISPKKTHL
ncbi:heparan sulfate 2-O-sulfotransferase 1 isoform X2 [Halyomorpha halys]|uniref:heparan sulfate 2-O-sulfotransferase 1 isoform X2 n=1 Tax=Halyomorpha halys TaxID=286706 RepID=UPI000D0C954B|nr:heparan sulfate 2-O-sulfotransferase 1 isoform X3 [Halyomorpha halys]